MIKPVTYRKFNVTDVPKTKERSNITANFNILFFCRGWDCKSVISWCIITSYGQISNCKTSQTSYLRKCICSAYWCLLEFLSQCFESFPKLLSFVHLTECISSVIYSNTSHMPLSINRNTFFIGWIDVAGFFHCICNVTFLFVLFSVFCFLFVLGFVLVLYLKWQSI